MSIACTHEVVWAVTCTGCERPHWVWLPEDKGAEAVEDELRSDGWACDGESHRCPSCQAVEGLSVEQVASDYRSEADGYPPHVDRSVF